MCVALAGCSSGGQDPHSVATVKWENGVISYNGKTMDVDEWDGQHAVATTATGGTVTMQMEAVKDLAWLEWNTQGIEEMDMTDFKKGKYYSEFLSTKVTVAYPIIDEELYSVGWAAVAGSLEADVAQIYDRITAIPWTDAGVAVDFGDFTLSNEYSQVMVRPDGAVIQGIIKIGNGSNDKCTNPYMVTGSKNEYTLYTYSDSKYTYYTYDGLLITMGLGLSLEEYVHFK